MNAHIVRQLRALALVVALAPRARAQSNDTSVARLIEPIRVAHHLPALGAAVINSGGLVAAAVTGVRKSGTSVAATISDDWHLGSDTKAMTAVILATLVERGKLTWESTIGDVFADLAQKFPADFRAITVTQLLSHHAGLPANIAWRDVERSSRSLGEQRINALKTAAATKLESRPGSTYLYSNLGYTLAGTIAERVAGKPWETLMREMVFAPLGMSKCGFGGLGTEGKIDQPWPHEANGTPGGTNGPRADNAFVMGPAGIVHCPIADWARFIADQLSGENGNGKLLKPETYKLLHTPQFRGTYAFGWLITSRPWSGGPVFTHAGSNTMNYCVVWIAPSRDFAVLSVTNQGGNDAQTATDAAVGALIQTRLK